MNENEFQIEYLHPTVKDFMIHSYEDVHLSKVDSTFEKRCQKFVGKSLHKYNIIILRDPFNFMASRIEFAKKKLPHQENRLVDEKSKRKVVKLWKEYAYEFINHTDLTNKITINYNLWFQSKKYRKDLLKTLDLYLPIYKSIMNNLVIILKISSIIIGLNLLVLCKTSGHGQKILHRIFNKLRLRLNLREIDKLKIQIIRNDVGYVSVKGGGSSFDGLKYRKGNEMQILKRWTDLKEDRFYRSIFRDKELIRLSNKIFGHIPGTEVLYK
jgi:hypothetical protein